MSRAELEAAMSAEAAKRRARAAAIDRACETMLKPGEQSTRRKLDQRARGFRNSARLLEEAAAAMMRDDADG